MTKITVALLSNHGTDAGQQAITHIAKTCNVASPSVGYISSAADTDRYFYQYTQAMYQRVGLTVEDYVDFESGFSDEQLDTVLSHPIVHLSGGNTFQFLQGVQQRRVYNKLRNYAVEGGRFVGLSAGALLLTPDIAIASLVGDEAIFDVTNTHGLALVDVQFLPHVNASDHSSLTEHSQTVKHPVVLCDDHSALIWNAGQWEVIGEPYIAVKGQLMKFVDWIK